MGTKHAMITKDWLLFYEKIMPRNQVLFIPLDHYYPKMFLETWILLWDYKLLPENIFYNQKVGIDLIKQW